MDGSLFIHIQHFVTVSLLTTLTFTSAKPQNKIVNLHPFTFHLNNPQLCSGGTDVLLWIHTAPNHFRQRLLIRNTWGNPKNFERHKATLVFFLGISTDNDTQAHIEYESETYHDIVQETFLDSYRNLTYKAIMGCKWTTLYCKSADIVVKADDDMVVDIYLLFRHIDSLRSQGKVLTNTILCDVWYKRAVERASGKWKVSLEEYAEKFYPPYCPGLGLVMTADIVPKMYNESLYEPYFWVDDVYFTGLLAQTINVTFQQLAATVHFGSSKMIRTETNFQQEYQWMFYHIQEKSISAMLWENIHKRELNRREFDKLPAAA